MKTNVLCAPAASISGRACRHILLSYFSVAIGLNLAWDKDTMYDSNRWLLAYGQGLIHIVCCWQPVGLFFCPWNTSSETTKLGLGSFWFHSLSCILLNFFPGLVCISCNAIFLWCYEDQVTHMRMMNHNFASKVDGIEIFCGLCMSCPSTMVFGVWHENACN